MTTASTPRRGIGAAVRRTHSLPVEALIFAVTVVAWQFARVPFEVPIAEATEVSLRIWDLERALGIAVEPDVADWLDARPGLHDAASWFYEHMDQALVAATLAALCVIDPRRYAPIRTAFVLMHLPALAVVALLPAAPPRWTPGVIDAAPVVPDLAGDLRNGTAALVSLHVGVPALLAAAAIWVRPRSPLAWATLAYPALILTIVVATGHHFFVDALVGVACAAIGALAARAIHGDVPRSTGAAGPVRIAATALGFGVLALAVTEVIV